MTLNEVFLQAKGRLKCAGIDNPSFEAACILEKHTGVGRRRLPIVGGEEADITPDFWGDVGRRCSGEPLQYILGEWEFMGLSFRVGPGVLIPRPETELLAGAAISFLSARPAPRLLELCAGTGCSAIAAAKALKDLTAWCLEYSEQAVVYLEQNIVINEVQDRVKIIRGDMFDYKGCAGLPDSLDAVICNPPYVCSGDIAGLQREVSEHEPVLALDGGEDGLAFYRAAGPWLALLMAGGLAAFEVGDGQAGDVTDILREAGLERIFVKKDYAGIGRVVGGYKR